MTKRDVLKRLPLHVEEDTRQIKALRNEGRVLGVITEGERGMNLYPGPRR